MTRDGSTRTLAHGVQYAPLGPPEPLQYGNGLSLSQLVDTAYRMTDISVPGIMALSGAANDANGNLTLRNEDTGTPSVSQFTYDTLDHLDTASGLFGDRDYDLNRNGNRTQVVADGETTVMTYPKNSRRKRKNQPNSDTFWTYTHDANGSITAKTSTVSAPDLGYEYDAHNRLIRTTSDDGTVTVLGEYAYNGLGQRVSKDAGGEVFEYRYGLGGELLAVIDGAGQPVREFVYLNTQPLAVVDHGADEVYYVHNDHLGTPRALSDETGARVWTAIYDPFGAAAVDEDPDQDGIPVTLNLRFPGQYYDQETGLHYNYYRDYDSQTGRYLESDPIGLYGGLNTYAYVGSNPLLYIDPYGLWRLGDPLPQWIVDTSSGFGDAISNVATFGLYSTAALRDDLGIDGGVRECSDTYRYSQYAGNAWTAGIAIGGLARGYQLGREISFGRNFRIAPFGNRTGHVTGRYPHYHRRGVDRATGETLPGQGIGRHRPWDSRSTDRNWRDRF